MSFVHWHYCRGRWSDRRMLCASVVRWLCSRCKCDFAHTTCFNLSEEERGRHKVKLRVTDILVTSNFSLWTCILLVLNKGIADIWLNATLNATDNRWMWSDGNAIDLTDPLWQPGKPQGDGKDCFIAVYKAYNDSYLYSDVYCNTRTSAFVCEILLT